MTQYSNLQRTVILTALCVSIVFSAVAHATKPIYSGGRDRAAIRGYDVVAYFTQNEAIKGSKEHQLEYKGAKWFFSSQANMELFRADPERYEPQYGGYCAYAVAVNKKASIKPEYFTIHEDKLYLNFSKSVYKKWNKDVERYISDGDANWPEILAR